MIEPAGSYLSIDLGAVVENYRILRSKSGTDVAAVVKANSYGLGADKIVPVLDLAGCRDFFVATAEEGAALRKITTRNIFVLGGIHTGNIKDFAAHRLLPVLNSLSDIAAWSGACAIHFDTGMNRLGLSSDEADEIILKPELLTKCDVKLAMSHFACSDEADHPLNALQQERFGSLQERLLFPRWSLCNSSGIFHCPYQYNLVRPGYALYGGNPTPDKANPMRDVVKLNARVLQTRQVKKGDSIGYGAMHVFNAPSETATLGFGYADGFHRAFGPGSHVYYEGQACPVLGRVSMDAITVEIGHLKGPKPSAGAVMEVLGLNQGIDVLAASAKTIGYEVLTSLGTRYARRYINAA